METSFSQLNATLFTDIGKSAIIYEYYFGDENEGWPGSGGKNIIEGGEIFTNLFIQGGLEYQSFTTSPSSGYSDGFDTSTILDKSLGTNESVLAEDDEIYVIVKTEGDAKKLFGIIDNRDSRIEVFTIPNISDIQTNEEETKIDFTNSDVQYRAGGGGVGQQQPTFKVGNLNLRIFKGVTEIQDIPPSVQEYVDVLQFPLFISKDNYDGITDANPGRVIDWSLTNLSNLNEDFNFYPTSNVKIIDTDLQSYYEDENNRFKASSPTTVELSFDISKYQFSGELTNYVATTQEQGVKFKFLVLDWNDNKNMISGWENVFEQWPVDMDSFVNKQQDNLFKFGEITNSGDTFETDISLKNTYISPGLKTIKAVVFSYADDTSNSQFQILRWKFVTIRIYLDNAKSLIEDFSDIGGADFVTLPWPNTTPVISGISEDSAYIKSLTSVLSSGKISEVDVIDSSKLLRARENDELGDYLGNTDFEQSRVFNTPYSMADLLMITGSMVQPDGTFHPHTDDVFWSQEDNDGDGIINLFPMESCVGLIFINDSMNPNLRRDCILELNPQELDGDIIRDSAGNGNRGILIGDYKIDKPSKDIPIRRKTEPKISETDSENGAI